MKLSGPAHGRACEVCRKVYKSMSDTKRLTAADLFEPKPQNWGLRGDPYLWEDMKKNFSSVTLPVSTEVFIEKFRAGFEEITGIPLTQDCHPLVPEYSDGGMSAGQVSGRFWLNEALPLLLERLKSACSGSDKIISSETEQYIIVQTQRLYLRKIRRNDKLAISRILQDEKVMYAWEHGFSDDEVIDWIEQNLMRYQRDGYSYWAVIEKNTGDLVGLCGLLSEKAGEETNVGVGYIFGKSFWHMGYAYESASACVDYAFRVLGVDQVTAQIRPNNHSSIKVAEKLGMTVRSQFVKRYRGKDMVHLLYSIEKETETCMRRKSFSKMNKYR